MGSFLAYMIQVAIVMTLLYLAYKWLMSTTTFHAFNRGVLLAIYAVSWLLPALPGLLASSAAPGTVEIGLPVMVSLVDSSQGETVPRFDWLRFLLWIYMSGAGLALLFTLAGTVRMAFLIAGGVRYKKDGYTLVVSRRAPGPFSWGRYVVVRPEDLDDSCAMILAHEHAHLRLCHWLDLIPAQLTAALQWFSPAAWLMMREVKDNHEFQVDRIVAGNEPAEYQLMLLKKTVGSSFPVFADSLHHKSLIKKRIIMMMSKKSSPKRHVAALALPAVAAVAVLTLSQPAVADVVDSFSAATLSDVSESKVNASDANVQIPATGSSAFDQESRSAVVIDSDNDGIVAEEFDEKENTAPASAATQITENSEAENGASAMVTFIDGKKQDFQDLKDIDPSTITSMAIVKNDPAYPQGKIMIVTKSGEASNEDHVHLAAEKTTEYKGGQSAFMEFLSQNIKWPAGVAQTETPVTVRVILQFTIGTDGQISDLKTLRSQGDEFDAEAKRVLLLTSGNWIPAENDGKPVASKFTVPITFKSK
ncbi:MAG: M56 family metallopeptidase [Muribaculaceae bacterium]|nr:M56 family metallopeptidase [Muribaculaceae bacterium]